MNRADVTDTVAFTGQPVTRAGGTGRDRLRVLLVEDDPADAFLVRELLDDVHAPVELDIATSMADARTRLAGIDCVLLDLGLPDASGLTALRQVLSAADGAAVCVLTGLADEHIGVAAVAEGAQDYLVKGRVDGEALKRSLRYAVERRRADEGARRLREAELRQAESARLERGLLPQPLISSGAAALESFYRPGQGYCVVGLLLVTASMRSLGRRLARLVALAMLVSPLLRWYPMAVFRRTAATAGPLPVRAWWASSRRVTSRIQCSRFSMCHSSLAQS